MRGKGRCRSAIFFILVHVSRRRWLRRISALCQRSIMTTSPSGPSPGGDGAIVEFRSVADAVRCAIEVQNGMVERNAGVPPERRIEFRIGIHLGDVVEESDGDLMGDGVNI